MDWQKFWSTNANFMPQYFQKKSLVKFGYSEKATKFEKIFHLKFDVTE